MRPRPFLLPPAAAEDRFGYAMRGLVVEAGEPAALELTRKAVERRRSYRVLDAIHVVLWGSFGSQNRRIKALAADCADAGVIGIIDIITPESS